MFFIRDGSLILSPATMNLPVWGGELLNQAAGSAIPTQRVGGSRIEDDSFTRV